MPCATAGKPQELLLLLTTYWERMGLTVRALLLSTLSARTRTPHSARSQRLLLLLLLHMRMRGDESYHLSIHRHNNTWG